MQSNYIFRSVAIVQISSCLYVAKVCFPLTHHNDELTLKRSTEICPYTKRIIDSNPSHTNHSTKIFTLDFLTLKQFREQLQ
jgi:hypothetical protein